MREFRQRKFNRRKDIPVLKSWLEKRGEGSEVALDFMPPTGVVVSLDGRPICVGFMIRCDNGMAINSDLVSNSEIEKEIRQEAVQFLRECLYQKAKEQGFKFVTVFTKITKLEDRLQTLGFTKIDSNLTQLGRFLWP